MHTLLVPWTGPKIKACYYVMGTTVYSTKRDIYDTFPARTVVLLVKAECVAAADDTVGNDGCLAGVGFAMDETS